MADDKSKGVTVTTKKVASTPIVLRIFVRSPGGKPIAGAKVVLKETNAEVQTNNSGIASISMREDEFDALASRTRDDGEEVKDVNLEASKPHHGPIASGANVFTDGPVKLTTELSKKTRSFAQNAPFVDAPSGAVRRANAVLVEGGTLGELYDEYTGWIRLRRLSSGEVQRELVWRIAHDQVVLENGHEPTFTHDLSKPSCKDGCSIAGPDPTTARVLMKRNVVCGIEIRSFLNWDGAHHTWVSSSPMSFNWQPLHQRFIVGFARLCYFLNSQHGVKVIVSQGFRTNNNDAHQDGRAFDLGGVACAPITETKHTLRDGVDFLVPSHWGKMHMLVQKSGAAAPERLGTDQDNKQYNDTDKPTSPADKMLYRLDPVPGPAERDPTTSAVSTAHLLKAQEIFRHIYEFCAAEFTHRQPEVGPLNDPTNPILPARAAAAQSEDSGDVPAIGTVTGNLFYPDVPRSDKNGKSGREAHFNHFHIQIGTIKMGVTVP